MPHYFFDTSALVKRDHIELGSTKVDEILVETGSSFSIARLTFAELSSVFAKKVRMGAITGADFDGLRLRFYADVRNRILLPVRLVNAHFESAGELISRHGKSRHIYALDAIQLAVALSIQQPEPVSRIICADQRLCDVALLEGLTVINPEQP
jgi:predicted nucleic acid-binding protein